MISGKAKLAGVMGKPVSHSLSPKLHNYWIEQLEIDGAYVPLAVSPKDLEEAFKILPKLGFKGWNLTVPHKEAALKLVEEADQAALSSGAVNTVVVREGKLFGMNTDVYGFMRNMRWEAGDATPYLKKALVIGAGGAARAIVYALKHAGADVTITNRTQARAAVLGVKTVPWEEREQALKDITLLVNATTLGMNDQPPLELSLENLPHTALVADIVYAPLMTEMLRQAKARGNPIVTGIGMLIHQAVPGFKAWFGKEPEIDVRLEEMLLA